MLPDVDFDIVRFLISNGISINAYTHTDSIYMTALHISIKRGLCDITRLLLEHGADIKQKTIPII